MERPEGHEGPCPCNLCVAFDVAYAVQEGGIDLKAWRQGGLIEYIQSTRQKKLNWNYPPDCILCGGTSFKCPTEHRHFEVLHHNEVEKDGKFFTSWLLYKEQSMSGVYRSYIERTNAFSPKALAGKDPKDRLIKWACLNLQYKPEKCIGVAARDLGDWIEIRLGFTERPERDR